jgi:hypothetical protein
LLFIHKGCYAHSMEDTLNFQEAQPGAGRLPAGTSVRFQGRKPKAFQGSGASPNLVASQVAPEVWAKEFKESLLKRADISERCKKVLQIPSAPTAMKMFVQTFISFQGPKSPVVTNGIYISRAWGEEKLVKVELRRGSQSFVVEVSSELFR